MEYDNTHLFLLVFYFLGMVAFSLLINRVLLRFVTTLGTKNQPGTLQRWSAETKPAIGGLGFFILFLISFWVYSILFDPHEVFNNLPILGLLIACTLAFVMGLTDDAYNTRPVLKFSVQVLCGVVLVVSNNQIQLFNEPIIDQIITVVWVIGMMNSINMLDNMDGIAATVGSLIVLAGVGNLIITGRWLGVDMVLLLAVLAALIGFLYFNWHPSRMYMGDTGSQFLGVILAYIGIKYCWNVGAVSGESNLTLGISAVLLVFLLPIVDTTVVTINRLRIGQSPFVGGRDHTTHHLSYRGLKDRQITFIFAVQSIVLIGIYFLIITHGKSLKIALATIAVLSFLGVLLTMLGLTHYNKKLNRIPSPEKLNSPTES